jgi:hypothetical protein
MAKFKPILINSGPELEAARDFQLYSHKYRREKEAMMKRFQKESEEFEAAYRKSFRECFRRVTMNYLDDPDEAFVGNTHYVDCTYVLEHGVAFINKNQNPQNPDDYQPEEDSDLEEEIEDFPGSLLRVRTH